MSQLWRIGPEWLQAGFEPSTVSNVQSMPRECALELKTTQSHSLVFTESDTSTDSVVADAFVSFTIRLVRGSLLGSRIGYLAAHGISMLGSLPPQCHTPFSSLKRLNCLVRVLRSEILGTFHTKEFSSQGFFHRVHWRGDCLSSLQVLEFVDCLEYPCCHSNLESVLNLVGSKID